jgi:hypothetical protein
MSSNPITFKVSRLKSDWQCATMLSDTQLTSFCNNYIRHAIRFLHQAGYTDVHVQLCDGYVPLGSFEWQDNQKGLRLAIMADYLNPQKPKTNDLTYLYACDSPKG